MRGLLALSASPPGSASLACAEFLFPVHKKRSTRIGNLKIPTHTDTAVRKILNFVTYNAISFKTKSVKISKLCLALVELIKVSLFESYSRVSLINLNTRNNE